MKSAYARSLLASLDDCDVVLDSSVIALSLTKRCLDSGTLHRHHQQRTSHYPVYITLSTPWLQRAVNLKTYQGGPCIRKLYSQWLIEEGLEMYVGTTPLSLCKSLSAYFVYNFSVLTTNMDSRLLTLVRPHVTSVVETGKYFFIIIIIVENFIRFSNKRILLIG